MVRRKVRLGEKMRWSSNALDTRIAFTMGPKPTYPFNVKMTSPFPAGRFLYCIGPGLYAGCAFLCSVPESVDRAESVLEIRTRGRPDSLLKLRALRDSGHSVRTRRPVDGS